MPWRNFVKATHANLLLESLLNVFWRPGHNSSRSSSMRWWCYNMQVAGLEMQPFSKGWPTLIALQCLSPVRLFSTNFSGFVKSSVQLFYSRADKGAEGRKRCNLGPVAHQANCKTSSTSKTNELLAKKNPATILVRENQTYILEKEDF